MNIIRTLLAGLVALLLFTVPTVAQRILDVSTLNANVTATATLMSATATDAFSVGDFCIVDKEVMVITANDITADDLTVQRGQGGTAASAHDNTERIYCSAGGDFKTVDPDYGADCVRGTAQAAVLPWINIRTGNQWSCRSAGTWNGTNTAPLTYNSLTDTTG